MRPFFRAFFILGYASQATFKLNNIKASVEPFFKETPDSICITSIDFALFKFDNTYSKLLFQALMSTIYCATSMKELDFQSWLNTTSIILKRFVFDIFPYIFISDHLYSIRLYTIARVLYIVVNLWGMWDSIFLNLMILIVAQGYPCSSNTFLSGLREVIVGIILVARLSFAVEHLSVFSAGLRPYLLFFLYACAAVYLLYFLLARMYISVEHEEARRSNESDKSRSCSADQSENPEFESDKADGYRALNTGIASYSPLMPVDQGGSSAFSSGTSVEEAPTLNEMYGSTEFCRMDTGQQHKPQQHRIGTHQSAEEQEPAMPQGAEHADHEGRFSTNLSAIENEKLDATKSAVPVSSNSGGLLLTRESAQKIEEIFAAPGGPSVQVQEAMPEGLKCATQGMHESDAARLCNTSDTPVRPPVSDNNFVSMIVKETCVIVSLDGSPAATEYAPHQVSTSESVDQASCDHSSLRSDSPAEEGSEPEAAEGIVGEGLGSSTHGARGGRPR